LVTESENYAAGRSGIGGVDYASSAWRAGDLERSRVERENAAARNQASLVRATTGVNSGSSSGTYSESSGGGFTFFSILAFVVAGFFAIGETTEYFFPNIRHEILPYVGPDGLVSKNVFFLILTALLATIGFLIRRILRWVVGIGIAVAIAGGVVRLFVS